MANIQNKSNCTIALQNTVNSTQGVQSDNTLNSTLQKRQWTKYISKGHALTLMYYNQNSLLFKSYKNTSYCAEVLQTNTMGKLTTTYCKNRWCQTCNRIKTARLINNYMPQLENLKNAQFLTLTLPTITADNLLNQISAMESTWRKIYKKSKEAKYKKLYTPLKGIRKAETTIRPNGQYHYHFHLLLDNEPQASWVLQQWLQYNPTASRKAQDIRTATKGAYKELFKYAFKSTIKMDSKINAKRYDVVFAALKNKRTFQAFGGIKKIDEDFKDEDLINNISIEDSINKVYKWVVSDWYDKETGEPLLNLEIPSKVKDLTNYPQ